MNKLVSVLCLGLLVGCGTNVVDFPGDLPDASTDATTMTPATPPVASPDPVSPIVPVPVGVVVVDPCLNINCGDGLVCDNGQCVWHDPCRGVVCNNSQVCSMGVCITPVFVPPSVDSGMPVGPTGGCGNDDDSRHGGCGNRR
jgi:hypothetical protein